MELNWPDSGGAGMGMGSVEPSGSSGGGKAQVSLDKGQESRESTQPDCKKLKRFYRHGTTSCGDGGGRGFLT